MRLKDYRALLVGAASGIGRETALAFVHEGARVAVIDVNELEAIHAVELLEGEGGNVTFVKADVACEPQLREAILAAASFLGGVDVLAQFVGVQRAGTVEGFPTEDWERVFAVNVRSQFLGAKYTIPFLRQSERGVIINMASAAGIKGGPGLTAYAASKGAVIAFTRALAAELAPSIRVNSVSPGWIDTPFNQPAIEFMHGLERVNAIVRDTVPLRRQGVPKEVAPCFVFLACEDCAYITGQNIVVDGGRL